MSRLISKERTPKAWLLKSYGDERQYAGNLGYEDELSKMYQYDSEVPNYKQIAEGDLVLLRDTEQLLGVARIELIENMPILKKLQYCPFCSKPLKNKARKKAKFLYLCSFCKHEFDEPSIQEKDREGFTAYFGDTFVATKGAISKDVLKKYIIGNLQFSIAEINFQEIQSILLKNAPTVAKLINDNNDSEYIKGDESSEYIILPEDRREKVFRQIKERRGQSQFRDLLRQRYGNQCMITGLKLLDVLEAAHISPYRGTDDNHPDNGLLLRADLHTLFDLNLLGINPESLEVKFHPKVLKTGYHKLECIKLRCSQYKPSQSALQYRWKEFLTRLDEDY
jgi:hypothetical protein